MTTLAIFFALFMPAFLNSQDSRSSPPAAPPGVMVQRSDQIPTSAPIPKYKQDPQYTKEARQNNVEGTVVVSGTVGTDGRLHNPKVERALGYGLDQKAIECVSAWRFEPARKDWVPYEVPISIEVAFRLHPPAANQPASSSGIRAYNDPDGAFILIVHREFTLHDGTQDSQAPSCTFSLTQECTVSLSYDPSLYRNTDFAGAEFWVDIPSQPNGDQLKPITTAADCAAFHGYDDVTLLPATPISGVPFARIEWDGVAAGTGSHVELFRSFHNGKCYEIGTEMSQFTSGYDEQDYASGRIRHLGRQEEQRVKAELDMAARSFDFRE